MLFRRQGRVARCVLRLLLAYLFIQGPGTPICALLPSRPMRVERPSHIIFQAGLHQTLRASGALIRQRAPDGKVWEAALDLLNEGYERNATREGKSMRRRK